uniref:Uncharacterized protein n=1 Tax=Anguilla anguilla TaxID=7936 RepID=A0A0E9WXZ9_ANGAN
MLPVKCKKNNNNNNNNNKTFACITQCLHFQYKIYSGIIREQ